MWNSLVGTNWMISRTIPRVHQIRCTGVTPSMSQSPPAPPHCNSFWQWHPHRQSSHIALYCWTQVQILAFLPKDASPLLRAGQLISANLFASYYWHKKSKQLWSQIRYDRQKEHENWKFQTEFLKKYEIESKWSNKSSLIRPTSWSHRKGRQYKSKEPGVDFVIK